MKFTKMHGLGNDYIYVNGFKETIDDPASLSIRISDRHFGIGGDGLILILPSQTADFKMRMFNADGSEGTMCGNGIRCVGKFVYDKGLTTKTEITIETLAGIRKLTLYPGKNRNQDCERVPGAGMLRRAVRLHRRAAYAVCDQPCGADDQPLLLRNKVEKARVWMGLPRFSDRDALSDLPTKEYPTPIRVLGKNFWLYCLSMGNPHAVAEITDVFSFPVEQYGVEIQKLSLFPESVNVEFVEVVSPDLLNMRVYERGSGETLACGTGACASAVAMMRLGKLNKTASVKLQGGTLLIEWQDDGVYMSGPATHVFDGEIDL